MIPDLLEEHGRDGKHDHPAHAQQPVARVKRQQRQHRIQPHLLSDQTRLKRLPAEGCGSIQNDKANAGFRLAAQKQRQRPWNQNRARTNTGSASTSVMTSAASTG